MKKKDLKRVLDALQQLNDVRLERIRELIRQRNDFQQETITLKLEVAEAQKNRDERLERWRQRYTASRDENKKLREELIEARRQVQYREYAAEVRQPAPGLCDAQMTDGESGSHDPHWCDKTPDHAKIITDGGSPHRCGDCKQEWVELD